MMMILRGKKADFIILLGMESLFQYLGIVIEKSVLFILWFRVTQEYDG